MGTHSIPVSDPENISTMKVSLALFVVLACVLAVSEAQLNYFYKSRAAVNGALGFPRAYGGWGGYSGYRGYGGYYGGYRGYFRGKRSADAKPEAEAEPEGSGDAQPEAEPEADGHAQFGYYGYPSTYGFYKQGYNNWGYYGRSPGYYYY